MRVSATIASAHWWRPARSAAFANWALCWLVLPNLPFAAMWLFGGMTRITEIVWTGLIGFFVRRAPFWLKFAVFTLLLTGSLLIYLSQMFRLSIGSILRSIGFILELRPAASLEYLLAGGILLLMLALAWTLFRRDQAFAVPAQLPVACAMLAAICVADLVATVGHDEFGRGASATATPFSSAASQTRFDALATDGNHLLIVMVEALGVPTRPDLHARLMAPWRAPGVTRLYDVRFGATPFSGSTTFGEVRELCGRRGDYPELLDAPDRRCLPARLAERGYRTTAIHAFHRDLFDRGRWYPHVGFQQMIFRDELRAGGAANCEGVFPGPCDRDVPTLIGRRLKQARSPQFIYWLTLSSHLPVPAGASLRTDRCDRYDAALARDHAMVCRLFSLWGDTNRALAAMLTDPALPPTDVLIVGDHAPPFFARSQRRHFDAGQVPWILLKSRTGRRDQPAAEQFARSRLGASHDRS